MMGQMTRTRRQSRGVALFQQMGGTVELTCRTLDEVSSRWWDT